MIETRVQSETECNFWISERSVCNVPMHWHKFYEVELCTSGQGKQIVNGKEDTITRGTLTFLTPMDFHRLEISEGKINLFTFCFYEHTLPSSVIQLINENKPPFVLNLTEEEYLKIFSAYKELENEAKQADPLSELSLKYKVSSLCMDIIRKAAVLCKNDSDIKMPCNKELDSIQEAVLYVNGHYAENITRKEVAALLHLNPSYFSTLFKNKTGISFSRYILDCRMARAMHLLRYTGEKIGEILRLVGYNHSSVFYRKFEEYYHMSPSEARRLYKE